MGVRPGLIRCRVNNFFVCGPKYAKFSWPDVGGVVHDQELFAIFDMLIRSEDIRDQSRKLSKIAKNFGPFCCRNKFLGARIVKIVPNLSPLPRGASTEKKFREDTPTSPEVIESNRLNFRPDF